MGPHPHRRPSPNLDGIPPLLVAPPLSLATPAERVVDALGHAAGEAQAAPDVCWCLPLLGSDLACQWAVEQELAREGLDRAALDHDQLIERARQAAETASAEIEGALHRSARDVVVPPPGHADLADPARAAFVALYEAGLVERLEKVAWRCPRCACGLGPGDVRPVTGETPVAVLRLQIDDPAGGPPASLAVEHAALELLGAVTAVGVPPGYTVEGARLAGRRAAVPVVDEPVPVVEDPAFAFPVLVTPGHDPGHWDVARRLGLPVTVLAEEAAPFAAREGALERLAADGMLAAQRVRAEDVTACAHCGTVASARLAPHWVLDEELGGPWCLDRELWDGVSLPVGWCAECAKPTVAVAAVDLGSCAICFGELRLEPGVLDPLFVVAAWVAETVRGHGAVFVGGGPQWLGVATALALRVEAEPVSVLGSGEEGSGTEGLP